MALSDMIKILRKKGINILHPETVYIGSEVQPENISNGVTLYPGCRIYGKRTIISPGVVLGYEAPVTLENCSLSDNVELKGGFFKDSLFLDKVTIASSAHVRESCLLEEEVTIAHCVGLKHTILMPFVTLGSLINFCDCLMAGGTSRKDHSEVGSSYIHFNFTPHADKATPSLIGDVARGVMLNQPRIFLGGQGGLVGPARLGFGTVVAAGSVFRGDYLGEGVLLSAANVDKARKIVPKRKGVERIFVNNIHYIANLIALEQWYMHVRKQFFSQKVLGDKLYKAALKILDEAKKERVMRLESLVLDIPKKSNVSSKNTDQISAFLSKDYSEVCIDSRDRFLNGLDKVIRKYGHEYVKTIQGLDATSVAEGVSWLQGIVNNILNGTFKMVPSLKEKKG